MRPNTGEARPNTGVSRQNTGVARPNTGGARPNTGGARRRAGRPRRNQVPEPDAEHTYYQGYHVPVGPINVLVDQVEGKCGDSTPTVNGTMWIRAANSERGMFPVFYVWNPDA